MPGYSFKRQFVEPIRAGTKGGTIRTARRTPRSPITGNGTRRPGGHARPGEPLMLWCLMRTPGRFKIAEYTCATVEPIELYFGPSSEAISLPHRFMRITTIEHLNTFAVFDGFECWQQMREFWHGKEPFIGWHIRWLPLPEAIDRRYQAERIERMRAADWDENQGAEL